MDIEKLIETLRQHGVSCVRACGKYCSICDEAATALSTLQAENAQLRAELEQVTAERDAAVDADKAILWLKDYVFEDSRKIYTNGARIIPYFRVLQALRDKAYNGLKED